MSDVVQREVSKHFTTVNDVLQERMLAVSRSPRETRFLLHSRDTALFYNEMFDFLGQDSSSQELWRSTIECQRQHDENQNQESSSWENNLRYALCIVIGTRGHTVNNKSPDELVRTATNVLFGSSSPNGLFPGKLVSSRVEALQNLFSQESERDAYYHALFEIPYILLTHTKKLRGAYERLARLANLATKSGPKSDDRFHSLGLTSTQQSPQPGYDTSLFPDDAEQHKVLLNLSNILLGRSILPFQDNLEASWDFRQAAKHQRLVMKKSVPFNNLIDSSSIVKIEDEWMFNYPDFFRRKRILQENDYVDAQEAFKDALLLSESRGKRTASDGYVIYSQLSRPGLF